MKNSAWTFQYIAVYSLLTYLRNYQMIGSPIYIETSALPISQSDGPTNVNVVTGQLGSVMKESVNIAYTYARHFLSKHSKGGEFVESLEKSKEVDTFFKRHQVNLFKNLVRTITLFVDI